MCISRGGTPICPRCTAMPSCSGTIANLVSVVLTGKVSTSAFVDPKSAFNISAGDTVTVSFLAEKTAYVRNIEGQGIVTDGISPYLMCSEEFALAFSNKQGDLRELVHLGPQLPDATGVVSDSYWFSLMGPRPIKGGAWVSTAAVDPALGVPLTFHGAQPTAVFTGFFDVVFAHAPKSTDIVQAYGTYDLTDKSVESAKMKITRDWAANVVATADFTKMTIGAATLKVN